jgi:putative ABC transport system permease protein
MKYIPLILAGLWRKPARTILTFLSIVVAFVLFGVLASVKSSFTHQLEILRLDRLYVDNRFPGMMMPMAYKSRIESVPGVRAVIPVGNVGGYWKQQTNPFGVTMTTEDYVIARPEYTITRAQLRQLDRTRTGIIVSKALARRYGWKVGDRIPITSQTAQQDGSRVWTFDITAIADNSDNPDEAMFALGSYKYFDEARAADRGTVQRYIVRIPDERQAARVGRAIDNLFANSPQPTRTNSEKNSAQGGLTLDEISFFTFAIIGAVLFMILFITGNTMMQSIRERVPEFAVLKTIGFSDESVLTLVLAEAVILCVTAGLVGLGLVKGVVPAIRDGLPNGIGTLLLLPWSAAAIGLGFALLMALISAFIPALRMKRLNVVDALAGR